MMQSELVIDIRGEIDQVWAFASAVEHWARFLPHYRFVIVAERVEAPRREIVEMACWRGCIPLRWRSFVEYLPCDRRIRFRHIGGGAKGMVVEWRLVQQGDHVHVSITHELTRSPYWFVRWRFGSYILFDHLIAYVARRTLRTIKLLVERGAQPPPALRGREVMAAR